VPTQTTGHGFRQGVLVPVLAVLALLTGGVVATATGVFTTGTSSSPPSAPAGATSVCNQSILNSPYSYDGPAATFTAETAPDGLPTFGSSGTDFPTMTSLMVIPDGDNSADGHSGAYNNANTIHYFTPGHHIMNGMYAGHDSVYIGGYSVADGKAIVDGVDGATDGTGAGGGNFSLATPAVPGTNISRNTWMYLTVKNYASSLNGSVMGNVNGGSFAIGDTFKYLTVGPNDYGWAGSDVPPRQGQSSGGGYGIDLGDDTTVQYNCLIQNAQGGFNGSGSNITITDNEIVGNGLGVYPDVSGPGSSPFSCGCSGGGKLNFSINPTVNNNYVHDNYQAGIWLDFDNVGADVSNNYIKSNWGVGIFFEANYNGQVTNNTLIGNGWASNGAWPEGVGGQPCFGGITCTNGMGPITGAGGGNAYAAIYIANSSANSNITSMTDRSGNTHTSRFSGQLTIANNTLTDNFGGIDLYTDTDRYPDGINNNSACGSPLNGGSTTYYRQSKVLRSTGVDISGAAVTGGGSHQLCGDWEGVDPGNDPPASDPRAPEVGMGVFDLDANTFLGNVATVTSTTSFTLDRSPGDATGRDLLMSAYGGCGPANYFGGGPGVQTGQPAALYWDNCIWGTRDVKVHDNTLSMNAATVTGCTTPANQCGFNRAIAFNAGVPALVQYWHNYSTLAPKATGGIGNVFSDNTYTWAGTGGWKFQTGLQGNTVSQAEWLADPYNQDVGSTFG
jgi:parallel beta-helix repeat protein